MVYDAIIIGSGSMGMAAGYYLAKEGKKVALVDTDAPPHTNGSHHGETRIIRHAYGEGASYVPLALRAQELWRELEDESGSDIFLPTGVLSIGTKDSPFIKNVIASAETYALPVEKLTGKEINDRWPGFDLDSGLLGCFEKNSGVLMSEEAIRAFRYLAVKHGANLFFNDSVKEIITTEQGIEIRLEGKNLKGNKLIVTAGKGTNQIMSLLGVKLPLEPVRKSFSWFDADASLYGTGNFPAWTFDDGHRAYYGFPSLGGTGIKIGRHDGFAVSGDGALEPYGSYPADEEEVLQFTKEHFTEKFVSGRGKVCTYTNTADEDFIIDHLTEQPNILVACGFSGHGFKFSTVVGEILSQLAMGKDPSLDISAFSLERFN